MPILIWCFFEKSFCKVFNLFKNRLCSYSAKYNFKLCSYGKISDKFFINAYILSIDQLPPLTSVLPIVGAELVNFHLKQKCNCLNIKLKILILIMNNNDA